jgi:hypothetical protein
VHAPWSRVLGRSLVWLSAIPVEGHPAGGFPASRKRLAGIAGKKRAADINPSFQAGIPLHRLPGWRALRQDLNVARSLIGVRLPYFFLRRKIPITNDASKPVTTVPSNP